MKWYIVEQCDLQTKNWHQVNVVLPSQYNLRIDDLMSGKEYLLRVVAENDKERSKALEIKQPFSIKVSSGRILIKYILMYFTIEKGRYWINDFTTIMQLKWKFYTDFSDVMLTYMYV